MTTLYRPVPITSAAQAEAFPIGTLAMGAKDGWLDPTYRIEGGWLDSHEQAINPAPHGDMIGATALVPIEAEEEYKPDVSVIPPWPAPMPETLPNLSRYVTPWEAV